MNIDSNIHRSQPLQLSNNQSFYMPQVNGLIPLKGHTSVVINCENHVSFFFFFNAPKIFTENYKYLISYLI